MSVLVARPVKPSIRLAGQRPGLAAEVAHLAHPDADLLGHLTAYGVLEGLPRLAEAGQGRPAARRPGPVAAEQDRLVVALAVGDRHDHRRVGARELRAAALRAPQLVARRRGWPASRRSAGRTGWRGATRRGRRRASAAAPGRAPGRPARSARRAAAPSRRASPGASSGDTITARWTAPPRSPSSTSVPSGASAGVDPLDGAVDRSQPVARRRPAPASSGRPSARRATPRRCAAGPSGCARGAERATCGRRRSGLTASG